MVLKGCLEPFDYLAKRFVASVVATSAQSTATQAIFEEAEEQQKQLTEKVYDISNKLLNSICIKLKSHIECGVRTSTWLKYTS